MAPPIPHQLYPLLEVEYDDPLLPLDDEVSKRRSRDPYILEAFELMSNEYYRRKLADS